MPEPYRVGVLNDLATGPGGPADDPVDLLRLPVDELLDAGRLDRDVEFVPAYGLGLPEGTAAAVERAYARLVDDDVLLVVGPAIGDNALVVTPLAERHRLPTINWAGTERGRGEYMFHLQVGSHEDESLVIARHLAEVGARRVGVVHDRSPIGRRHLQFLQDEADVLGLRLSGTAGIAVTADDATAEVGAVLGGADAVVYLGLGLAAPPVARAVTASGFAGPRVMNTCGLRGYAPEFARIIDGWVYVDMHSDGNATLAALRRRLGPRDRPGFSVAYQYDMGRLVAEGLARAPERTRDGVRDGLEAVKWLPAAQGHDGTLLGFGHRDRGALHGRYLVLRQWRDGVSVEL
ncbi:ABC transporter substrate-binding protein [Trujillonella endophytica]|uniref:ABC-type branched-chain amino acid transport system, substrate-binding protein n=1 Tax=Trujillonella endophytica TaxID=673521 RepID=A0A1H8R2P9_9ACTN|nr:ABC transporter substrate-binding protein [Trujillella endophytica]SEO60424.1 ABC-type branched-chain amino acid transport system, substrate-binding protein [Trujillella endophytica]